MKGRQEPPRAGAAPPKSAGEGAASGGDGRVESRTAGADLLRVAWGLVAALFLVVILIVLTRGRPSEGAKPCRE